MAKRNENTENDNNNKPENPSSSTNTGTSGSSIPSYLAAAARLSTSYPLGAVHTDRSLFTGRSATPRAAADISATTGGVVIDYIPTYGVSTDATSALNRASFDQFNLFRSEISGNRPYEPVDHMIYRQCVDSLRELYATISRIYTIISNYAATNVYRARYIVEAMGYDFGDWNRNAANVYQWLVNHASAMKPFPTVPIGTISGRHMALATYIFTDGEIDSTQAYIFNQKAFYSYEVVDEVKGVTLREAGRTTADLFDMWDEMYEALQSSSDVYTMSADIRRAYKDQVVWELTPPDVRATVQYVKLDAVLESLMNCSTIASGTITEDNSIGSNTDYSTFRIYDGGNGILLCQPNIRTVSRYYRNASDNYGFYAPCKFDHLNFLKAEPETAEVLNAVRLHPVTRSSMQWGTVYDDDESELYPINELTVQTNVISMSTEVVVGGRYFTIDYDDMGNGTVEGLNYVPFASCYIYDTATINAQRDITTGNPFDIMSKWSACDWSMPIRMIAADFFNVSDNNVFAGTIEDVQNYVPVSDQIIQDIHDAMLLAEFGIK